MADGVDLVVRGWSRYGMRRLYVSTIDGLAVGWVDLLTGARQIEAAQYEAEFAVAVDAYQQDHPPVASSVPSEGRIDSANASAEPIPDSRLNTPSDCLDATDGAQAHAVNVPDVAAQPAWIDLASNRPGQGVRARAEEELAAMRGNGKVRAFLARAFDAKTDERAYRVGAAGEETVGARLEKLADHGWHVLHSVAVGTKGSDIDHVVIGPGGVFTVNTKTHPGGRVWVGRHAIKVNGQSQPYLRNSRFEGKRAGRLLTTAVGWPVEVIPVLIFLTGTWIPNVTIKQQPDDVWVLDRFDVPRTFKKRRPRLTAAQVEAIYEQARRSTTWTPR